MGELLWKKCILPLNMQRKTTIFATSSPASTGTYYYFLMNVRNPQTNRRIFKRVKLKEVCDECLRKGKAIECTHLQEQISGSKSYNDRWLTSLLYNDDQESVQNELLGLATAQGGRLFSADIIDYLEEAEIEITEPARAVYVGIDPSGAGKSDFGIAAWVESITPEHGYRKVVSTLTTS